MAKISLTEYMQQHHLDPADVENVGPFVTISRQFGCHGFSLGLLLLDILNEEATPEQSWHIYHKEILTHLATETNLDVESLEKQLVSKPRLIVDFFRSFSGERMPSGQELRNRIASIIRYLAIQGHAIILGQASAGATRDLPNGLSVRLEAPLDWRVKQVAFREGISDYQARKRVEEVEEEREYLQKVYEARFPRKPAFDVVYDASKFSLSQMAQSIAYLLKLKGSV